jgi:hypothetical protein
MCVEWRVGRISSIYLLAENGCAMAGRITRQHATARRFRLPSPLYRWAEKEGYFEKPGRALVAGGGHLVEAESLAVRGWEVDATEIYMAMEVRRKLYLEWTHQPKRRVALATDLKRSIYDLILVTHVLEFIEVRTEREALLRSLSARLSREGRLLLSLRGWSDVRAAKHLEKVRDGYITGLGTWTRGYTMDEAEKLVQAANLRVVGGPRGPRSCHPEQVRIVCAPMNAAK